MVALRAEKSYQTLLHLYARNSVTQVIPGYYSLFYQVFQ